MANATATSAGTVGITTANTAEVPAIELILSASWSGMTTPVELTDAGANGLTRVLDGNQNVYTPNAAAQNAMTKFGTGVLTFGTAVTKSGGTLTERDLQLAFDNGSGGYKTLTYTVKIAASNQIRISTDADNTDGSKPSQHYNSDSYDYYYVEAYTAAAQVTVGTITLSYGGSGTALSGVTYDSVLDLNDETADGGLNFFYSISPKNNESSGAGTADTGADSTYGAITIPSIA